MTTDNAEKLSDEIDPTKVFVITRERLARLSEQEMRLWCLSHIKTKKERDLYTAQTKDASRADLIERSAWALTHAWTATLRKSMPPTHEVHAVPPAPQSATYCVVSEPEIRRHPIKKVLAVVSFLTLDSNGIGDPEGQSAGDAFGARCDGAADAPVFRVELRCSVLLLRC